MGSKRATDWLNANLYAAIARETRILARARPRFAPALRAFLCRQRAANRALATSLRPALWLVQRS